MNPALIPLLELVALLVITVTLAVSIACIQVTKTYRLFSFLCDSKYWCLSILNYRFRLANEKGLGTKDFIKEFSHTFLAPSSRDFRKLRLTEENRSLIMKVLSDPSFLEKNFGISRYDKVVHKSILAKLQTN